MAAGPPPKEVSRRRASGQPRKQADGLCYCPQLYAGAWNQSLHHGRTDALALMHGRPQLLLIRRKSANMITARCRQFGGEDICTYNSETCSSADGWAGRAAGISYECDSASAPAIHHDGADGVKVYVVGVLQFGEQARQFPIHVAEQGVYQSSLRRDIVAIVIVQRGGPATAG
jgi:hypothetical protein